MSDSPLVSTRRVPLLVPVTGLSVWDWRESYAVFLAFVIPILLLTTVPALLPFFAIGLIAVGVGLRARRIARWWTLLRFADPVVVDAVEQSVAERGTVRLAHATGWRVHRGWFTGEIYDNTITYTVGGAQRTLVLRGLPYTSGVVLAQPTRADALCVSAFPFDLRLEDDSRWSVSVPPSSWLGAAATAVLYSALVLVAWWTL
jgi:hypothetical protein